MKEDNVKKTVIGSMVWKLGERILSQGVAFIISIFLARLLSPDDYGTIALVTIFINLAAVFINSGFATSLIQKKNADATDFSTIFFCSLIVAIIIYGILYAVAPLVAAFYSKPILIKVLRVFALQVPLSVYSSIQVAYIARHMLFKKQFFSAIISTVLSGMAGIFVAFSGGGVWALIIQSIVYVIVNSIVLAIILPWHPNLKFSVVSAKRLMRYGTKILGADLSGTFFIELRSLIIGRVYTSADLAYYNKGYQLPSLLTSNLNNSIMAVMFPALSNYSDDLEKVKQMTKRSVKVLSYVVIPCLFGLMSVMEPLILLLYTEKWAATIPYGQVLSVGFCFGVLGILPLQVLKAIGRSDVVLGLEIWKKPVYLILLIIGVNINVFAVAVSMVIYDIYGGLINMMQLKKYIHYSMKELLADVLPALILGIIMAVVVAAIPIGENLFVALIIKILGGAGCYVGLSLLFKVESFQYLKRTLIELLTKKK